VCLLVARHQGPEQCGRHEPVAKTFKAEVCCVPGYQRKAGRARSFSDLIEPLERVLIVLCEIKDNKIY